ncbi:tRNA (N(6)-L-threonylcarbamoyladenosine(37)-C(2))-methylthiotransferase MtaB [Proteiniborus sp. MB09-C3]|uniref:tRNA (N(6)-L-threonylcarbamoyladenosine(37)-C(2))- methylthiotransferase MtaB n=1 Tax=Proteiniborus sp. MB09-C3 TaxID=3050072 RepID=UPI002556ED47|nr:tRNA (N(6)-L-threonylcarbamoyladenosine(37)-C(2))-methylthiotransferase MtaB [Proteiniborus sp. MB09-C3]WIV10687.1 tRNA (N(6)-L-threonylcarbamoyladenosine(37)-C(2))-methylthiotransferase MtaB [Proteiniborus sp. MB09-C3]
MNKVAFHTLGCKVNQYETEAMAELFEKNGYEIVNEDEIADVYVINTCTITNLGDRKSRQFIRRAKNKNSEAVIAVVGCYAQTAPEEIMSIGEVDIVIGTKDRNRIVELSKQVRENREKINIVTDIMKQHEFEEMKIESIEGKTRAFLKIQEGCNQYCSYCIIPYARGPIRSRKLDDILYEVKKLSENGFKEVVLTGIHVASYGKDMGEIRLIDVIERVHEVPGIERIRLSSIEPTIMTKDFLDRLIKLPKVCDHFHLSLQSGSNSVLERMNRKYTTEEYKEIVELIREYMPNVGITTDIIVGFPGETEDEFVETCKFVDDIGFSRIHVFPYSPRKGTPAAKYRNQISGDIKHQRSKYLIRIGEKNTNKFNNKFIGTMLNVLFEEQSKQNLEFIEGYTTNYIRVLSKGNDSLEGEILPVKLDKVQGENLIGKILS